MWRIHLHKGKNQLNLETSPYLQQHKDNPIWWYAWGDSAFEAARVSNKPIFLSIGYSSCYWCHVMEHESFEKQDVADLLNANFISIKLDREERPDIDQIYMDAIMAMHGHGGWPMSVFLTPKLEPFWGGTYFPHAQFLKILQAIQTAWSNEPDNILDSAHKLTLALSEEAETNTTTLNYKQILKQAFERYSVNFDHEHAGFGHAPKFPPSMQLSLLLRLARRLADLDEQSSALNMVEKTLKNMARGGIYDQIAGGFHRYATDANWLTPHFEKMLYDNALLAYSYLEAYQSTKNDYYAYVAYDVLDFVLREMTTQAGGFCSALDAGDVGAEGAYYVWERTELEELLSQEELRLLESIFPLPAHGNFEENKIILALKESADQDFYKDANFQAVRKKILGARQGRKPPLLDDKIITGWNALMISAFAKAYQVSLNENYLKAAVKCWELIKSKLLKENSLLRSLRNGEARHLACAEDYAFLIDALLNIFECTADFQYLEQARSLQKSQDLKFWDETTGAYYYSEAPDLVIKRKDSSDGAIPSANSVSLCNLLRLGAIFAETSYSDRAHALIQFFADDIARHPAAFPKLLQALDWRDDLAKEVVLICPSGLEDNQLRRALLQEFFPNKVLLIQNPKNLEDMQKLPIMRDKTSKSAQPTVYVCEKHTCQAPSCETNEMMLLMNRVTKL